MSWQQSTPEPDENRPSPAPETSAGRESSWSDRFYIRLHLHPGRAYPKLARRFLCSTALLASKPSEHVISVHGAFERKDLLRPLSSKFGASLVMSFMLCGVF